MSEAAPETKIETSIAVPKSKNFMTGRTDKLSIPLHPVLRLRIQGPGGPGRPRLHRQSPGTLLPGSLEHLLQDRELDTVRKEFGRALIAVENDPPVAITASRAAFESLLKTYIADKGLTTPRPEKTARSSDSHG